MSKLVLRHTCATPATFPTPTWAPKKARHKGRRSGVPRSDGAYTLAEQARVVQLRQELATGAIPTGYKRLQAFTHRGAVALGPHLRAAINIEVSPWTLERLLTHAEYNVWVAHASRRGC